MAAVSQEFLNEIEARIGAFFLKHNREDLDREAAKRRIILYPVATIADIAHNPQLGARQFWVSVSHPELNASITYPGCFIRGTEEPCGIGRRAPLIGEHNEEVYSEILGLSHKQLEQLKQEGVF